MKRAYSFLTVKAVDDDQRVIEGVATTPTPDRVGDIVEPLGVKFKNPLPLLHQHRSDQPVGTVRFDKPTKDGINFRAKLPKIEEPGPLKDRVDTAWGEVKSGLVRAVSIGFRDIEFSRLENGGLRFIETEVLELSLVTIPANADATIQTVKSIDAELLAATGREQEDIDKTPPAPRQRSTIVVKAQEGTTMKKTTAEQISAFEATRVSKAARMGEIMEAAGDTGETLNDEQQQEYDGLKDEVKSIDEHLTRLRDHEKMQLAQAAPVNGKSVEDAGRSREGSPIVSVKRNVEKGIILTRVLGAKYIALRSDGAVTPIQVAQAKFGDTPEVEIILRAPVAALTTSDATAAGPLVVLDNATGEFAELLRPQTIIGRIPGLRRVPFNIKFPRGTSDPTAYWVGQAQVKPVSSMAFDTVELTFAKVAGIVIQTDELMRFSKPSSELLVRDGLVAAIARLTDRDFLDPSKAADDISPASITNGVTAIVATGTTADAMRADLGSLFAAYAAANMSLAGLVLVMTSVRAMRLSLMRNTLGQSEFPNINLNGGTLEGIPVVTSENIVATGGSPVDGDLIVAINAPEVMLADDGGVDIDISREASVQMETSPDSPATASTIYQSLWQRNMVGIKAERFINWKKRRDGAVQYISSAKYA